MRSIRPKTVRPKAIAERDQFLWRLIPVSSVEELSDAAEAPGIYDLFL